MRDTIRPRQSLKKRPPQIAVFQHMAHRPFFNLGMIKVHEERRCPLTSAAVRNFDIEHWLRVAVKRVPKTQCREHAF